MKTAILMDAALRPSLISDKVIRKLSTYGEVALNETGGTAPEDIIPLLRDADIAITSWGNIGIGSDLLEYAPDLKLVAHAAGSVKPIVTDALFEKGVKVTSSARILSTGVSETALGLTIACAKDFFQWNRKISQGEWITDYSTITELYGITIGVIGAGFAGAHYIELLQVFDVDVAAYDPLRSAEELSAMGARKMELQELLAASDIISLHAPSLDSTYHMIDEKALARMKDQAILINTARGSLIDEDALYHAMSAGKLKYACLDVTDPEPPTPDNPLRSLPNCIMTPHIAGQANNGKLRIGDHVLSEITRFLNGEPLRDEITRDMLSTMA